MGMKSSRKISSTAASRASGSSALSWAQLKAKGSSWTPPDPANGPTHSQSGLRLFGQPESAVRVTLYRDNHAWCPYCQKTWLWLEEKRIPYRISKVSMFCYGQKEAWFKKIVPSGMLPALILDGRLITDSDVILGKLEQTFGPLGAPFSDITQQRRLERTLFSAWCRWLCYHDDRQGSARQNFERVLGAFDKALGEESGPWLLGGRDPSTADVVFVPFVERMSASLFYYKGYTLRDKAKFPRVCAWLDALESRSTYLGTQADAHTHSHDLPPQLGGCVASGAKEQIEAAIRVDVICDDRVADTGLPEPKTAAAEAIYRVWKHHENVIAANPCAKPEVVDEALRCALTRLSAEAGADSGEPCIPSGAGADKALRYIRDRVNCPRDMSVWAARRLRRVLETTAASAGSGQGPPITTQNRRDQDPRNFRPRAKQ